ncbi:EF-P beta-lysylation protein EpmB [Legionella oakridgensis]|uniref:L-lysine 2,3-aminomutase n=2 Tax=Legionella oakridgensis TaxID=29423 RepID=W0BB68_9GAMM|nr:EF-P beta-lysylation protein EpmB [Legionella oakridgensis]AHE65941.1 lysine-2,3-aminomutase-related protein [Legionella oakridgensis ATCC 33761 = DSM 21215]ETO94313.1 L-lysine 2,3-aminomutase [Legionella oakridgensis RV-2-2007]KTD43792.1 lysine 2,3-aminomutase [Legionella oakridgensis]STY15870.1 lysine 2,3-aminomutase [Legionella longbeachae]
MRDSTSNWQKILAQGFSSASELLEFLQLPSSMASHLAEKQFKTRVPRAFAELMEKGNRYDPLLMQVLAVDDELQMQAGFVHDPLKETSANPVKGLIHKYHGRVLLVLTGGCVINCRYCFRRHFPYQDNNPGRKGWQQTLEYIANDSSIQEVILSGGDPLLAQDGVLSEVFSYLSSIPHVRFLRIHTRIPVVLPERVNASLLELLASLPLQKVIVLHSNHPHELDERVAQACMALRHADCHLLNQSVLLAGVNNDSLVLAALSQRLFSCGVLPYYLHFLDKVQGAAHFSVTLAEAKNIFRSLQEHLPGYLVPRFACEQPGKKSKTLIMAEDFLEHSFS